MAGCSIHNSFPHSLSSIAASYRNAEATAAEPAVRGTHTRLGAGLYRSAASARDEATADGRRAVASWHHGEYPRFPHASLCRHRRSGASGRLRLPLVFSMVCLLGRSRGSRRCCPSTEHADRSPDRASGGAGLCPSAASARDEATAGRRVVASRYHGVYPRFPHAPLSRHGRSGVSRGMPMLNRDASRRVVASRHYGVYPRFLHTPHPATDAWSRRTATPAARFFSIVCASLGCRRIAARQSINRARRQIARSRIRRCGLLSVCRFGEG
jgi:hypothetical protein